MPKNISFVFSDFLIFRLRRYWAT